MEKEKLEKTLPRLDEIPFQSEKQYMATLHPRNGGRVVYVKGAVERLLSLSKYHLKENGVVTLTEGDAQAIIQANTTMAREAMRVMATAYLVVGRIVLVPFWAWLNPYSIIYLLLAILAAVGRLR